MNGFDHAFEALFNQLPLPDAVRQLLGGLDGSEAKFGEFVRGAHVTAGVMDSSCSAVRLVGDWFEGGCAGHSFTGS